MLESLGTWLCTFGMCKECLKAWDRDYAHFGFFQAHNYAHFGCVTYTWALNTQNVHNHGPKCVWAATKCVWASPDTVLSGIWAGMRKEMQQYLRTPYIEDLLLICRGGGYHATNNSSTCVLPAFKSCCWFIVVVSTTLPTAAASEWHGGLCLWNYKPLHWSTDLCSVLKDHMTDNHLDEENWQIGGVT
jgi:hypothetical protein